MVQILLWNIYLKGSIPDINNAYYDRGLRVLLKFFPVLSKDIIAKKIKKENIKPMSTVFTWVQC